MCTLKSLLTLVLARAALHDGLLQVVYPWGFAKDAEAMVDALLDRNPVTRLGSLGLGSLEIIENDFFGELSFAELERRTVPAPYIPDIRSPYAATAHSHRLARSAPHMSLALSRILLTYITLSLHSLCTLTLLTPHCLPRLVLVCACQV